MAKVIPTDINKTGGLPAESDASISSSRFHLALKESIYVDDIIAGADSEDNAFKLHQELVDLLGKGGFFPRKWASSSPNVMEKIPSEHRESPLVLRSDSGLPNNNYIKVLGVQWGNAQAVQ